MYIVIDKVFEYNFFIKANLYNNKALIYSQNLGLESLDINNNINKYRIESTIGYSIEELNEIIEEYTKDFMKKLDNTYKNSKDYLLKSIRNLVIVLLVLIIIMELIYYHLLSKLLRNKK